MEALIQDVRHGIRSLSSDKSFVLLSILCLGIGIGANTTVFTVVNGLLLQPLPLAGADRLVTLHEVRHENPANLARVSYPNFRDWQEQAQSVAELAAIRTRHLNVSNGEDAERLAGALITWNLFRLLGIEASIGRGLLQSDDSPGAEPVVVLSEGFWRQRYASNPGVIGQALIIDARPHTVVGVMPHVAHPAVPGPLRSARLWIPLTPLEHERRRDERSLIVYAKLAGHVGLDRAKAHLTTVAGALENQHPENDGWGVGVASFVTSLSTTTRQLLLVLAGAVAFVLLIACGNVANLMLARANRRRREIAVRTAMGASRGRIVRQLLIESLLVGFASAAVGVVLAWWGVGILLRTATEQTQNIALPIDGRVLTFTIGIAVLTSLVFGVAPALHGLRGAVRDSLGDGGRDGTTGRTQKRLRNTLVVAEVASALVLLVVATLFVRSFMNLLQAEGGIDTSKVVTLTVEMPEARYRSPDELRRGVEDVVARLESLPGVETAAASNLMPLRGGGARTTAVPDGQERRQGGAVTVLYGGITSRFFEALAEPLLYGRAFTDSEARAHARVAIVNRRMADRLWPGQDPLGRRFRLAALSDDEPFTVVGLSRDLSNWDLSHRPLPTAYVPYAYAPVRDPHVLIRATRDPALAVAPARTEILAVDPALSVFAVQPLSDVHRQAFWRQELLGQMLAVFGVIATLLAAVGVYGVLSYLVSQRTREIGIRMALGADRGNILRLVVREGLGLVIGGVVIGLAGAFAATRVIRGQLFEVSATDPASFAGVALLLVGVGLVASCVPAARAAAVDPMVSLRH